MKVYSVPLLLNPLESNREMLAQCLITHLVVRRRIAVLDQFACRHQTMSFLSAVRTNSAPFEELFVSITKVTPDAVKSLIRLKPGTSGSSNFATVVLAHIHKFVDGGE